MPVMDKIIIRYDFKKGDELTHADGVKMLNKGKGFYTNDLTFFDTGIDMDVVIVDAKNRRISKNELLLDKDDKYTEISVSKRHNILKMFLRNELKWQSTEIDYVGLKIPSLKIEKIITLSNNTIKYGGKVIYGRVKENNILELNGEKYRIQDMVRFTDEIVSVGAGISFGFYLKAITTDTADIKAGDVLTIIEIKG